MESGQFPFKIHRFTEEDTAEIEKYIKKGVFKYYIRVGPAGYCLSNQLEPLLPKFYNLELRPDDVFVAEFPKSGACRVQELVWLVANDFDYDTATSVLLVERFCFMGFSGNEIGITKELIKRVGENDRPIMQRIANLTTIQDDSADLLARQPSPRFIKTHLPFSMLPPNILDKTKVVFVARDPRDVAVSYYHQLKSMEALEYKGEFKDFWSCFVKDLVIYTPYFAHFKEAWALRHHPNMLLLFYEELSEDMSAVIRRVAKFLGKNVTDEQIAGLSEHLKFENFRKDEVENKELEKQLDIVRQDGKFIREGKKGDWRLYFGEEMMRDAEQWMEEGLRGTGFMFHK